MDIPNEKRAVSLDELKQVTGGESIPEDQLFSQYREKLCQLAEACRASGSSRDEALQDLSRTPSAGFLGLLEVTAIVDGIYQGID